MSEQVVAPLTNALDAIEMVAVHFREVAVHVTFEGGLPQKWVVDALFRCVEVHIRLIDQPPKGAEAFTETVYKRVAEASDARSHPSGVFSRFERLTS
jgi:hypothetical protein